VSTTSHQANIAPDASIIAAIIIAQVKVSALLQTAGHILLATSLAHKLTAIYIQKTDAISKYNLSVGDSIAHHSIKYTYDIHNKNAIQKSIYLILFMYSSFIFNTIFI
jgi:translation elongation factor EF-Tu-like GTPase